MVWSIKNYRKVEASHFLTFLRAIVNTETTAQNVIKEHLRKWPNLWLSLSIGKIVIFAQHKYHEVGLALYLFQKSISPRHSDLMVFGFSSRSWKATPEIWIWWLSGLGSRSWQNYSQKRRFNDFRAFLLKTTKSVLEVPICWSSGSAPVFSKITFRSLALITF